MGIAVVRKNGAVLEMPEGPARFHADLRRTGVTTAVDKKTGRTYEVRQAEDGMHFTEQHPPSAVVESPLLIRSPRLPLNK